MKDKPHEKIRSLREKSGWTQDELATAADVSVKTIRRAEQGAPVSIATTKALASAFDIEWTELSQDVGFRKH